MMRRHRHLALIQRIAIIVATVAAANSVAVLDDAAASARARKRRVVEATYASPAAIVEVGNGGAYACSSSAMNGQANVGCIDIPVRPNERFLSLKIVDATGLPAPVWVFQEDTDHGGPVCGSTEKPMRIAPGVLLTLWIYPYMAQPLCPGVSSTGTVTATFSKVP